MSAECELRRNVLQDTSPPHDHTAEIIWQSKWDEGHHTEENKKQNGKQHSENENEYKYRIESFFFRSFRFSS